MAKSLKNTLEYYKTYTLQLIESLEKDDFDALNKILDKRQDTIEDMRKLEYTKEEFLSISEKLKILEFQNKLEILMNKKRNEIKREMDKTQKMKNANNIYNKNLYSRITAFNTKI